MAKYLKIRNWDRWQSYRKDRGQPPWIKVHRCVMRDENWVRLTDAQRGQLVAMWLLAADRDGAIPASPTVIQRLCFMTRPPDLQLFTELEFIERDAKMTSERRHDDVNMTSTRRQCDASVTPGNQAVDVRHPQTLTDHRLSGDDVNVTSQRRQHDVNVTPQSRVEEKRIDPPYSPPQGDGVSATSIEDEFNDDFWPNVPTKVGKGAARKAYAQARKKATAEAIVAGLAAYRAYEAKRKRQSDYRALHPATWLNGERWTDEIPGDRAAEQAQPKPCACGCGREAKREREGKLWHTDDCWWKTKQQAAPQR